MYQTFKSFFRRVPQYVWILLAIVCVGIFFRTYHFSDWLLFKGDAFRDAILVSNAYRVGIESLPLLGPRAGGTMLHLGPVFYYFQYTSVMIFQSMSAPVLAYPDLLFSILSLPMFFIFSRRYFSPFWSLALTAMLAVSFMAIEYGRFAWNPNSTLFFTLIFSYAIQRLYDTDQNTEKRRGWWAGVAGLALAIASQLHFSVFLALPIILITFVLLRWQDTKKIASPKILLIFFVSIALVYLPVFISDYLKHGENARQFFSVILDKSSKQSLLQSTLLTVYMFAKFFLRIGLGIVESGKALILVGGALFVGGLFANTRLLWGELSEKKRNFLQWTLLMSVVYFILYIPLAEKIDRPRFFLPFMMMPYLFFGYIAVFLQNECGRFPRLAKLFAFTGILIILLGNTNAVWKWFSALENAHITAASAEQKRAKGKNIWLTWSHYERAAAIIDASCEKPGPVFLSTSKSIREYDHSFEYAVVQKDSRFIVRLMKNYSSSGPKGCYYHISLLDEKLPDIIMNEVVALPLDIGNVLVTRFYPKTEDESKYADRVEDNKKSTVFIPEKIKKNSRVYWGDVWYRLNH